MPKTKNEIDNDSLVMQFEQRLFPYVKIDKDGLSLEVAKIMEEYYGKLPERDVMAMILDAITVFRYDDLKLFLKAEFLRREREQLKKQ